VRSSSTHRVSCEICDALQAENILLMNNVKTLEKKLIENKKFFNKLLSEHLKKLLGGHQPSTNYDYVRDSTSHACMSTNETMFVKPMNTGGVKDLYG
jgi:S-adenosylmethionine:tRNA-ribosyltransferase-isomerase (queuine synthetase)